MILAVGTAGAAILIACISLAVSIGSVVTTVVLWRRSGARVVVEVVAAYLALGNGNGGLYIGVEAANIGRAAVSISGWGYRLPNDTMLVMLHPLPFNPALPHRLEPGSSATWYMGADEFKRQLDGVGRRTAEAKGFVHLATGAKVFAKKQSGLAHL